jgi:murein DD-endopeptidase MepM/ murein hydrolase activator NlpD
MDIHRYRRIEKYQNNPKVSKSISNLSSDVRLFARELTSYLLSASGIAFVKFGKGKNFAVTSLYTQRGKMAKRLMHSGMAGIAAFGVMVAPIVAEEFPGSSLDPWEATSPSQVLSATDSQFTETILAEHEHRDRMVEYEVKEGDTVSTISEKFGVSVDTIRWQNDLASRDSIKIGQVLEILPLTGVSHKVVKGDTVYSIAKKYDVDPQGIVNYPFNTFVNDETFELAIGQTIIVPDGVKPEEIPWSPVARVRQTTPNAGTVVAAGSYVWPTQGSISQSYAWYHKGLDIANRAAPAVVAADAGRVVVAGWIDNYGYGNRVVIDHGNGTKTRYAHLSQIYVSVGQTVNRGDAIGKMGSTGRSTGTHLHFEIIQNGANINPLSVLR